MHAIRANAMRKPKIIRSGNREVRQDGSSRKLASVRFEIRTGGREGHGVKAQCPSVVMDEKDIVVGH